MTGLHVRHRQLPWPMTGLHVRHRQLHHAACDDCRQHWSWGLLVVAVELWWCGGGCVNAERGNQLVVAPFREIVSGDVLLSHTVSRAVPLALKGLASGFGMEPGVSLSLWSPKLYGDTGTPVCTARPVNGCAVVGVPDRISGTAQWTRVPPLRVGSSLCSSPRPISTGQLHVLPRFHFLPINPVVSPGALPG